LLLSTVMLMVLGIITVQSTVSGVTMKETVAQKREGIARFSEPELTLAPPSDNAPDPRLVEFPPTGARPPAGAAAGYDSDGRGRHVVGGRRKAHGRANQIHATIWSTRLSAKAV